MDLYNIENTSIYKELSKSEQIRFKTMTKEEIIDKYIELKTKIAQSAKDIEFYRSALISALREHETLKNKYPDIDKGEYNPNWSWVTKIVYILKKTQRPLLSSEMIELLVPHEEGLRESNYRPQAFSPHLGKAVKYHRVVAYKRGGERGNYYVLPDWIDAQSMLLKQYEERIYFK
jgi:hypothetical protein